jgi:hypothetical protein
VSISRVEGGYTRINEYLVCEFECVKYIRSFGPKNRFTRDPSAPPVKIHYGGRLPLGVQFPNILRGLATYLELQHLLDLSGNNRVTTNNFDLDHPPFPHTPVPIVVST